MKKLFFLVLVISSNFIIAQTTNKLFENANTLYKEAKYTEAIKLYEKIETSNQVSADLYFNLGNCYYKLNKVAPTIYYYEKALKLQPLHRAAANNLVFAKRLTLDVIEELPKTFLQKLDENYVKKLSYNQWAIVVVVLSFIASILFLLFYFAESSSRKRLYFVISILSFLLFFVSIGITFNQFKWSEKNVKAIVFSEKTSIQNAPTLNSDAVFTLHEGTKVTVLDAVDNWKKIKLTDGKTGWILSDELKEI